jgi:endonuclease III
MVVSVKAKSTRKMRLDRMAICFERLAANQPEPKTELDFSSPYTLLVAVVLSAQATDVGVNRATRGLFAAASTRRKWWRLALTASATTSAPSACSTPRPGMSTGSQKY